MSEQDWKYVFTIQGDLENPGETTLVGPFEDSDAADEYVTDRTVFTETNETSVVVSLDDSDGVLAALKKSAKKAAKKAKKEAKKQKSVAATIEDVEANGKGKKGKKKKDKVADAGTTEADASDVAASPEGEAAAPVAAENNGQPAQSDDDIAKKYQASGSLVDDKERLIEGWSRAMTKHEVIGPLNLSPNQRRVIAALKWMREVAKSNKNQGWTQPPPPIVGIDANDRIVVQGLDGMQGFTGSPKQWAVLKNGDPADVKEPIRKLKAKVSESV